MSRAAARFRISIKDHQTGSLVKVELIEAPGIWGEKRYKVNVNGRDAVRHPEASMTEVFDRLGRWIVRRA